MIFKIIFFAQSAKLKNPFRFLAYSTRTRARKYENAKRTWLFYCNKTEDTFKEKEEDVDFLSRLIK